MKKKALIVVPALILIVLGVVAVNVFRFIRSTEGRPAPEYTEAPVTPSVDKNEVMLSLLNSDLSDKFDVVCKYEINAGELGLAADSVDAAKDNSNLLNKAIKSAKKGTRILIPAGKYYIDGSIVLFDKKDIVISGKSNGSDGRVMLVNASYQPYSSQNSNNIANCFNISHCSNIKLENIAFDYLFHPSADGIITEVKHGKTYFKAFTELLEGDKAPLVGDELVKSVLTADDEVFIEEKWADGYIRLKREEESCMFSIPMQIGKPGQRICCRFTTGPSISYVIHSTKNNGVILENILCNSCPAGFVFSSYSANLLIKGLKVAVPDGSERLFGSNEDCMHLVDMFGDLVVTDSSFVGIGDDALNIHSQLTRIAEMDGNSVKIVNGRDGTPPYPSYIIAGESVELFDKSCKSLGIATVKSVVGNKITLDSVPEGLTVGCCVQNVSCAPDTVIKNCTVEFGRARGLLIQTKNAVISDCTFKNMRLSGILMAPDFGYWYEAGFTDNVLITNNTFENCASLANGFGVIHISTSHDGLNATFPTGAGHKNVSILDNRFISCRSKQISATGVQNLKSDSGK